MSFSLTSTTNPINTIVEEISAPLHNAKAVSAIKNSFFCSFALTYVFSGDLTSALVSGLIASKVSYVSTYLLSKIQHAATTYPWIDKYRFTLILLPQALLAASAHLMRYPLAFPFPMVWALLSTSHVFYSWYTQIPLETLCLPQAVCSLIF